MRTAEAISNSIADLDRDRYYNANEVAEIIGVEGITILRWIDRGWIKATGMKLPNGRHNFKVEDIELFLKDHGDDW